MRENDEMEKREQKKKKMQKMKNMFGELIKSVYIEFVWVDAVGYMVLNHVDGGENITFQPFCLLCCTTLPFFLLHDHSNE